MTNEQKEKICKDCGITKPLADFSYIRTRGRYEPRCKICQRGKQLQYAHNNYGRDGEKKKKYAKEHYFKNREKGLEYRRERYKTYDREEQLVKRRKWYQDNKERYAKNRDKYENENKDRLRAARRKWENNRLAEDINYRLHKTLAGRIRHELNGRNKRNNRTEQLIGCTIDELKIHIQNQFQDGMTWGNWKTNGWHVDHNIPLSWFNLENENCRKIAFSYKNMQPLWGVDNIRKKNYFSHKMVA